MSQIGQATATPPQDRVAASETTLDSHPPDSGLKLIWPLLLLLLAEIAAAPVGLRQLEECSAAAAVTDDQKEAPRQTELWRQVYSVDVATAPQAGPCRCLPPAGGGGPPSVNR
jgi:hypothetical protein